MTLAINILFLEPSQVGGTEPATCKILEEIDNGFAKNNKTILYSSKTFARQYKFKNILVKPVINTSSCKLKRVLYELFILPIRVRQDRIDLLHSMGYTPPLITHCPKIVTVYDLQFKAYPQTVSPLVRLTYNLLMPLVILSNQVIITSSKSSRKQIKKYYPRLTKNKKIEVIYLGSGWVKAINKKFKKENYIFTPAASHPHKNLPRLIEAFNLIKQKKEFSNTQLFISGSSGKQEKKIHQLVQNHP